MGPAKELDASGRTTDTKLNRNLRAEPVTQPLDGTTPVPPGYPPAVKSPEQPNERPQR